MQGLTTSDYKGNQLWHGLREDEDSYPLCVLTCFLLKSHLADRFYHSPLVMKVRSRASSVMSGASTPGGGGGRSLSERDLRRADEALKQVNGAV